MDREDIIGEEPLWESAEKCYEGVGWKPAVAYFRHHPSQEVSKLVKELKEGTYKERSPRFFDTWVPKHRKLMSISFRDRVYQRSLNDNALYPQASRSFIPDNFACQTGKGTDAARERLREFLRRSYQKHGATCYVYKMDIKSYYDSMPHETSIAELDSYIESIPAQMSDVVLNGYPGDKGFYPGSQMVQILGVALLNRMDHIIKEQLGIKWYIRYMDDFLLIHPDKDYLEYCRTVIETELARLGLMLNDKKTYITTVKDGIEFLGYIYRLTDTGKIVIIPRPDKIKKEKILLRRMVNKCKRGEKPKSQIDRHFESWLESISFGNSYKITQKMREYYRALWRD